MNMSDHPVCDCPYISMQAVCPAGACWVGAADWASLEAAVGVGGPWPGRARPIIHIANVFASHMGLASNPLTTWFEY